MLQLYFFLKLTLVPGHWGFDANYVKLNLENGMDSSSWRTNFTAGGKGFHTESVVRHNAAETACVCVYVCVNEYTDRDTTRSVRLCNYSR